MEEGVEKIVAVTRYKDHFRWYRSDRDLWILDYIKWRNSFVSRGYSAPDLDDSDRGGIHVVSGENADSFFEYMKIFEVKKDDLSIGLAKRFPTAKSWWDVADLFPIIFVDFDDETVAGFYSAGTPMEKFIPDGWKGEFVDFATEYPSSKFPTEDKFWVKSGSDLLKLLNERGRLAIK